jgi:hypothetical protein
MNRGLRMSEKKMVRRSVAIAIGIICIILIVGLGGIATFYMSVISDRDNTITSKDEQIDSLNFIIRDQNNTISSLNNQAANLQSQASNLHIWSTENSTVLVNNESFGGAPSRGWGLWNFSYAGYVSVLVLSNDNSPNVEVFYDVNGTPFDHKISLDFGGGTVVFPVLPTQFIGIQVNNASTAATATIIYYH